MLMSAVFICGCEQSYPLYSHSSEPVKLTPPQKLSESSPDTSPAVIPDKPIDLRQVIGIGIANNPWLSAAAWDTETAQAEQDIAKAEFTTNEVGGNYTNGKYGQALSFDGENDYVSVPASISNDINSEATIELWFQTENSTQAMTLLSIEGAYFLVANYPTGGIPNPSVYAAVFDGNSGDNLFTVSDLSDGQWHHLLARNNGTTTFVHLDGQQVATISDVSSDLTLTSSSSAIGAQWDGSSGFYQGLIDEVSVYGTNLDPSAVCNNYLATCSSANEVANITCDTSCIPY